MPTVDVLNINGEKVSEMELSENLFGAEINEHVVYQVVKNHLANKRVGTQSAKTRAEVRGGGAKPWRQKGTGRARQGSIRSPQWKGGGVVFAPKPRDYSYTVPKKIRRLALKSVLTDKVNEGNLVVVDDINLTEWKTREFAKMLSALKVGKKALVVTKDNSPEVVRSGRNIKNVKIAFVGTMNVYDILNANTLVLTKDAVAKAEEVYA
ncbi:50S ribosomal protein L4 [Filifactor alocis ATCC 35896]|jgi:50S ribosomal protein L4, bacterial/organelle|uniref:Large ribosomal subunit protein uL4 n=1 Tax=Filifactor alocis (strain ATCC 35896 / CCUG 47790 / D40 B5) TaxID=546269 RepID=D6GQ71_FILAD|nr:50S ribosomal protein L4 [Filifactor alocis]EFE28924.1 50S ribosomal protein L4 [Filifactor alocis ATCC 35896]